MANERLERLRALVDGNPTNSFLRYGLALELVNGGDLESARREFEGLLSADPEYLAAYYHSGRTLEKLGQADQARECYGRGIGVASRQSNDHARSELQAALDLLG